MPTLGNGRNICSGLAIQERIGMRKMPFFLRQHELRRQLSGECIYFAGSRFDTGSIEDAVCNILAEMGGSFKYVVTPNVHHIVRLLEDPASMRPPYERAWRVFCDSRVLSRLAWFSGSCHHR